MITDVGNVKHQKSNQNQCSKINVQKSMFKNQCFKNQCSKFPTLPKV